MMQGTDLTNFKAKKIGDLIGNKDSGLTGYITEFPLTFWIKIAEMAAAGVQA